MFQNLFIDKSTKSYFLTPVAYDQFRSVISRLSNINLNNDEFLIEFYQKYVDSIFPYVTSFPISEHSKYFWRTSCLGVEPSANKDQYWLDRGWSLEDAKKIKSSKYGSCSLSYYISNGYSKEDAENLLRERVKDISEKAKKTKKKKTEEDPTFSKRGGYGIQKWLILGYSEDDAKRKYEESKTSRFFSIQEFHQKNPQFYKGKRTGQIEYWINKGFSEDEAKQKVKESQSTFTLEKCIKKYGEIEGAKRFNNRQKKWTKSLMENFENYGDGRSLQSKWASEIIDSICKTLQIPRPEKEKWMSSANGSERYSYDFCHANKIIEFNGDLWHANPEIYNEDFIIPKCNIKAAEKWKMDKDKIELAESRGYEVLVIWESEFAKDAKHIINKCINFLTNE